jgi:UDP-GlcNAc:undecaprenyl-phosphate GlcNAc-1-phosphate transferase
LGGERARQAPLLGPDVIHSLAEIGAMWISLWRNWLHVWAGALTAGALAFGLTLVITFVLIKLAPRMGLMDHPGGRKTHATATPAVGGLGLALGCMPVAALLFPQGRPLQALGIAAIMLLITGVVDDRFDLPWPQRICAQVAAALVLVYLGGVRVNSIGTAFGVGDYHQLGNLAAPFTVLATVGLINAINMADGVDGLAGSIGMATLGMLAAAALYAGNDDLATGSILMMGGVAAFLVFNLSSTRALPRTFLGNAGSEFTGLAIAWTCFRLTQTEAHPVTPVLAPFLICVPVIDGLVLMSHRLRRGASPFRADRDHLHHLLLDAGFSSNGVVLFILGFSLMIGLAAAAALFVHIPQPMFILAFLLLMGAHYRITAQRAQAVAIFAVMARWLQRTAVPRSAASTSKPPTSSRLRGEAAGGFNLRQTLRAAVGLRYLQGRRCEISATRRISGKVRDGGA